MQEFENPKPNLMPPSKASDADTLIDTNLDTFYLDFHPLVIYPRDKISLSASSLQLEFWKLDISKNGHNHQQDMGAVTDAFVRQGTYRTGTTTWNRHLRTDIGSERFIESI
jgi:hypothetical protein